MVNLCFCTSWLDQRKELHLSEAGEWAKNQDFVVAMFKTLTPCFDLPNLRNTQAVFILLCSLLISEVKLFSNIVKKDMIQRQRTKLVKIFISLSLLFPISTTVLLKTPQNMYNVYMSKIEKHVTKCSVFLLTNQPGLKIPLKWNHMCLESFRLDCSSQKFICQVWSNSNKQ